MKKLCFALLISSAVVWISCDNPKTEKSVEQTTVNSTGKIYSCPMHPEVKSDKPGKCPKCGMDLEEVTKTVVTDTTKK